jgi:hypothetical protein
MMAFNAESVDFDNFNPVTADYGPRDIHAEAAMVTSDNIGQWALEFEKDLDSSVESLPRFFFDAERDGDDPIRLEMKPGVWIVKVWKELHVFKDGMFQKTFDVPKEQLKAVRKAHRDKRLELDREWEREKAEDRDSFEQEMEEKFERVQETGDWNELSEGESVVLRQRLREDEELQELIAAARERKFKQSVKSTRTVGPDYHAGSLFNSEGQEPGFYENLNREVEEKTEAEQTQFIPQVSIPLMSLGRPPMYPEGDEPMSEDQKARQRENDPNHS